MPELEGFGDYSGTPLSAMDTYNLLSDLLDVTGSEALMPAWVAYRLATDVMDRYCVVPPRGLSDPGRPKAPVGLGPRREWKQWQHERPDDALLWQWYVQEARKGVGLVLGEVSDGLHCFDWEGRAVHSGFHDQCVQAIRRAGLGDAWATIARYRERTPSGGLHYFYRLTEARPKCVLVRSKTGETYLEDLGQGEYVLVAPSYEVSDKGPYSPVPIHPDVDGCEWDKAEPEELRGVALKQLYLGHLTIEGPLMEPEVVDAIHAIVQRTAERHGLIAPTPVWKQTQRATQGPVVTMMRPTRRGASRQHVGDLLKQSSQIDDTVVGWLEQAGWTRTLQPRARNGAVAVTRPGKVPTAVSGLVGGDIPGMFHCFTSSSEAFDPSVTYTPLQVYARLFHDGDVGAATLELEQRLGLTEVKVRAN